MIQRLARGRRSIWTGLVALPIVLSIAMTAGASASAVLDKAAVDRLVEQARAQWDQPGVAMAIVDAEGGYVRGYGVRDLRTGAPVTPDTIFGIGSCSKAFAAATVAKLVDQHRLGWEDRVSDHLSWFRTDDPWVTHDLRVRDLLVHRSGLSAAMPRDAAADRMTYLKSIAVSRPAHPLRYEFSYTNDMFTLAGAVVSQVSGESWEQYARDSLWAPLGMSRTNGDHRVARRDTDSAAPHVAVKGRLTAIPWIYEDRTALPSGGVNSTASDLSRWMSFQLAEGAGAGAAVLSRAAFDEMHSPQTPLRGPDARDILSEEWAVLGRGPEGMRYESYGMGWFIHDYRGHKVLSHGGNIDGFRCFIGLLPEEKFGVAILANGDQSLFPMAVAQSLIDMKLGLPSRDLSTAYRSLKLEQDAKAAAGLRALDAARIPNTRPSRSLDAYQGEYAADPLIGAVQVRRAGDRLLLIYGRTEFEAVHWHYDVFRLAPSRLLLDDGPVAFPRPETPPRFAAFHIDETGAVAEVQTDFGVFRRPAAAAAGL